MPMEGEITATARLQACDDTLSPVGIAYLSERPSAEGVKQVDVMLRVWGGVLPGSHAVHIHETANCRPCSAAGGHSIRARTATRTRTAITPSTRATWST